VNATTRNLRRPFAGRMLADPARRTLETRPARRVCCAAKPYRSCDAVRGCAVLATDSRDMTLSCRSFYSRTPVVAAMPRPRSTRSQTAHMQSLSPGVGCLAVLSTSCTCYTITQRPRATGRRMIAPYLSLTVRDVPFRLYGSLHAVKVLRAALWSTIDCACSAADPAPTASRWRTSRPSLL
jgi:hypothetical protein